MSALIRKTDRTNLTNVWTICHPDPTVMERVTQRVNEDQAAGEGRSVQGASNIPRPVNAAVEFSEENSEPEWLVVKRTRTVRGRKDRAENPFPKLKL